MHPISAVENPAHRHAVEEDVDQKSESQDKWFDEVETISEPLDAGELVDDQSDISDYEETIRKKKKKAGPKVSTGTSWGKGYLETVTGICVNFLCLGGICS